jgi:HEAT repeat protein
MLAAPVLALVLAADFAWPGALEDDAQAIAKLPVTQRLRALEALTARGGSATLPLIVPLLADGNPLVRQFAARRLARAGHPAALEAATRWIASPAAALADRGLGLDVLREAPALTPGARQAVERALRDADVAIRVAALDTLERHEVAPSLGPVIAALDDDNREVRVRAVRLAAQAGDGRAVLPLLGRLEDGDRQVRLEAIRALGNHPRAAPALLRLATEGTDEARTAAVDALGAARVEAALPALVAMARRRPIDDVGRRAQLALGKLGSPAALAALAGLLRSPPVSDEAKTAIASAGAAAVPVLTRELDKGTPTSAAIAAALLGEIGDRRATAALATAAERRVDLAPAALEALGRLADPAAVPKLARAAESPDLETRRRAYAALLAIGDERAAAVVDRGFSDPDPYVRVLTTRLTATIGAPNATPGPATLRALAVLLADADHDVRRAAAHALATAARPTADAAAGARSTDARPTDLIGVMLDALTRHGSPERSADEWRHVADAFERLVDARDAGRIAAAWRSAHGPLRIALARPVAAAHAGPAANAGRRSDADAAALVPELLASLDGGGANARAAADALALLPFPDDARGALARAFAAAEASTRARLCPAIAATSGGGTWLAALVQARDEAPEVRAAAAWAARGNADARDALVSAAAGGDDPVSANARAALAVGAGGPAAAWTAARLAGTDGGDVVGRWVTLTAAGGAVVVWAKTDAEGAIRVHGLPAGALVLRAGGPDLRLAIQGR